MKKIRIVPLLFYTWSGIFFGSALICIIQKDDKWFSRMCVFIACFALSIIIDLLYDIKDKIK